MQQTQQLLRSLPAVSTVLESERAKQLATRYGLQLLSYVTRRELDRRREEIIAGTRQHAPGLEELLEDLETQLKRKRSTEARKAINATGVLLHTNLGRAPLAAEVAELLTASAGYGVVQINLEDNSRSKRDEEIASLLHALCGCEAATVVNNNAAATFMILNTMASGREVIISRGQLVEIGGSYRMPDVMEQSGAILKEVGTTNRTHLKDYESAISESTAAILYVEPSNYHILGFAGFPSLAELCELGKKHNIPVIADLGSGALVPTSAYGIKDSITIANALSWGATITCSSGDKLIGGPQAGIICGGREIVAEIRRSPFARMFRVDKLTLTGIEATLQEFVNGSYETTIPLYQMLSMPLEKLKELAKSFAASCESAGLRCEVFDSHSFVGGGTLPAEQLPSAAVRIHSKQDVETAAKNLRLHIPPIFCRIEDNTLVFDMRSLLAGDFERLALHVPEVLNT